MRQPPSHPFCPNIIVSLFFVVIRLSRLDRNYTGLRSALNRNLCRFFWRWPFDTKSRPLGQGPHLKGRLKRPWSVQNVGGGLGIFSGEEESSEVSAEVPSGGFRAYLPTYRDRKGTPGYVEFSTDEKPGTFGWRTPSRQKDGFVAFEGRWTLKEGRSTPVRSGSRGNPTYQ